jgi:oligoendopeptidase F
MDSKKLLGPVLGKININVGEKISAKLQPLIKQHVKTIEQITTKIAKLQARIVAAEKAFKDAVQKYQDMANNFIQEQTKQLADKISKELGINLAGALGGIGGGIKLSI